MKKDLIAVVLLAGLFIASGAAALDAPHNASTSMVCQDCHVDRYSYVYTDDTCLACHNNATGGGYSLRSAPKVRTHSSANTSSKYGEWTTQCWDCHIKHGLEQRQAFQSAVFLVSGTITSITDNGDGTTTFGYSNLVENRPGWANYLKWSNKSSGNFAGGNERGLILYPNSSTYLNQSAVSFEISSATAEAITVIGSINSAFPTAISSGLVAVGKPFALAYGQFVNHSVMTPSGFTRATRFFENDGAYSFAYSTAAPPSTTDPTVDSVCQVCHTQTLHWRADGTLADHFDQQNCVACHKHEEGFKVSCESCHTAPPATGAHMVHFDAGFAEYGTTTVQSTPAAYGFNCGICHSGTHLNTTANPRTAEVSFAGIAVQGSATAANYSAAAPVVDDPGSGYIFNYSDGSCSSVYCHGNYPGSGRNATVTFNSGAAVCGSCHNASNTAPPASGSHNTHASTTRYNVSCTLCHAGEISGAGPASYAVADKQKHVSGKVDWAFDTSDTRVVFSLYSIASGTALPSNGLTPRPYGTCSTTYCHSNGTSVATLNLAAGNSPVWGSGALTCTSCHGAPPAYPTGSPKANSHAAHAGNGCNICHNSTTSDGISISSYANHVNKTYDVNPDLASGVTFTYAFAYTGGSCSNISCHGYGSGTWGATLTCQNCHLGTADVDDFAGTFYNNGTASKIKNSGEWDTTGHGRPASAGPYASGNAAADLTATNACQYCHDSAITHNTASNPFRLRNIADASWGLNGVCQNCHAAGSSGVSNDSMLKNGTKKVGAFHYGAKHNSLANGGQFCWDCHDPHGDANATMIHDAVAKTSDPATGAPTDQIATVFNLSVPVTGTDYAKSTAPFNGICNVCHTSASHYTATSGDSHNSGTRCTSCHSHTGDTTTDAFGAVGGGACDSCHDYDTVSGGWGKSPKAIEGWGAHAVHISHLETVNSVSLSASTDTFGGAAFNLVCGVCHTRSSANHEMGGTPNTRTIDFGGNLAYQFSTGETPTYNGITGVSSGTTPKTCSNISCHFQTSPVWEGL